MPNQMYRYFTAAEIACRCGECGLGERDMSPRFMRRVVELRERCDFPWIVTSAARCPEHNDRVSTTGLEGPHTPLIVIEGEMPKCHSIDFLCYGEHAAKVVGLARQYGFTGVGLHQHGEHAKRFIHLDDLPDKIAGPRPWVWTY